MDDWPDPCLTIVCRVCEAGIGKPCKEKSRKRMRYMHAIRYRDWRNAELDRRRRVREAYLAKWILTYGSIFEEEAS